MSGDDSAAGVSATPRIARRWPFDVRDSLRLLLIVTLVFALFRYVRLWIYVQTGNGAAVSRPNVVDAFLPLGGLAGLKTWIATGYFDPMHPAAIVILVAVILTAWIFRRAPCAWLCPIGLMSEHLARLGKRLFNRPVRVPPRLDRVLVGAKYVGTVLFLAWLLSAPVGSVRAFMDTPYYAVADMRLFDVYAKAGVGVFVAVGVIVFASMRVKSAWCRYLCPYGALQGLFGVLSPIVLTKNDRGCTGCRRCDRACPNGVRVSSATGAVVTAECMGCLSCLDACPKSGILTMKVAGKRPLDPLVFGLAFFALFLTVVTVSIIGGRFGNGLPPEEYRAMYKMSSGVTLPGGRPEETTP